jgi:nucleoside-diphosphate-sugar epimerase
MFSCTLSRVGAEGNNMTVMVTGVGHVGAYAVRDLVDAGERVVLFGFLGGQGDPDSELPEAAYLDHLLGGRLRDQVDIVVGDVSDLDAMTAAAENYDVGNILHFATLLSAGAQQNPLLATHVNVLGTVNVFETAARLSMEKVVWASTVDVFGARSVNDAGVVTDDSVYDPGFVYGASKVLSEKLAFAYAEKHELDITGLRLARVYGFGEHVKLSRGGGTSWFANLTYRPVVEQGRFVVPFGTRSMDFLYVEDVADAFLKALGHRPGGSDNYLIGGDYRPLREAVDFVRSLMPDADIELSMEDLDLVSGAGMGFSRDYDSSRAARDFGWTHRFSMEAGVFRTINGNRVMIGLPALAEPAVAHVDRD